MFTNIAPSGAGVVRPWVDALRSNQFAVFAQTESGQRTTTLTATCWRTSTTLPRKGSPRWWWRRPTVGVANRWRRSPSGTPVQVLSFRELTPVGR